MNQKNLARGSLVSQFSFSIIRFFIFIYLFFFWWLVRVTVVVGLAFLPTAYVVRGKVMFWHASVCLSTPGGGYPSQVPVGGGYPARSRQGGRGLPQPGPGRGYPSQVWVGRYPTLGTPPSDLAGGYPTLGTPPLRPGQGGYPDRGYPTSGPPPSDLAGGYPDGGGVPHRVVLDMPWLVCLLCSRRRTFLFLKILGRMPLWERDESMWRWWGHLNTTSCNWTYLTFLHWELVGTQKPSFHLPLCPHTSHHSCPRTPHALTPLHPSCPHGGDSKT